jgi:hypothetical protein
LKKDDLCFSLLDFALLSVFFVFELVIR